MLDSPEDRHRTAQQPLTDELNALPAGTAFGTLEVLRTIGVGGFGIVYLAQDHSLQRLVAVKEYMPGQLAQRGTGSQVSVRSSAHLDTFEVGRRSFVNEARLLARFDHRSLLKVYQFWEANGTAYMAMPFLQGRTLKQVRQAMSGPPDDAFLLKVLLPLLDGLRLLHAESVYHRDIAPDNILLPDGGGDPILLDFGAARHAIGDRTQMFTAILKPSFAPIEQYGESPSLRQGPWTDLFALGAVAHYMILGRTPPPSTTRAVSDSYEPLAEMNLPGLSKTVLAAIDWSLRVKPQDRPQSVDEMRAALTGQLEPPADEAAFDPDKTVVRPVSDASAHDPTVQFSRTASVAKTMPVGRGEGSADRASKDRRPSTTSASLAQSRRGKVSSSSRSRSNHWLGPAMLGGGVAALAIAAAGWWWTGRSDAPVVSDEAAASAPVEQASGAGTTSTTATTTAATPPPVTTPTESTAELPVVKMSPPPPGSDKPIVREVPSSTKLAPVRDLSVPANSDPKPIPVTRSPAGAEEATEQQAAPSGATSGVPGTADPRAACGKKVFLTMTLCIDRLCRDPAYSNNRECVKLRELRDQRDTQRQR